MPSTDGIGYSTFDELKNAVLQNMNCKFLCFGQMEIYHSNNGAW